MWKAIKQFFCIHYCEKIDYFYDLSLIPDEDKVCRCLTVYARRICTKCGKEKRTVSFELAGLSVSDLTTLMNVFKRAGVLPHYEDKTF